MPRTGGVYSPPAGTKGVPGTTIQSSPYNTFIDDLTADANAARPITAGGTGATSASAARTALGLTIGTNVQAHDAGLQSISGLTTAADTMIYTTALDTYATTPLTSFARSLLDDANASTALTTLGVSAFIKTLLDDADAATARTTLGAPSAATTISAGLGLTGGGDLSANRTLTINLAAGLPAATTLTLPRVVVTDGNTAGTEARMTPEDFRTTFSFGSMSTQNASGVAITGGTISGITDLAVADGGTGASTASVARTNLGAAASATTITAGTGLSGGGDLSANRTLTIALAGLPAVTTLTTPRVLVTDSNTAGTEARMTAADFRTTFAIAGSATTITAGNGLTGGGDLTTNRTLTVGAGTGISVGATTVSVDATVWRDGAQPSAAQIGGIYAGLTQGAIGTYAFVLKKTAGTVNPGTTVAGTDLYWSNTALSAATGVDTGTWRSMGIITNTAASLALRIS